MMKLNGNENTNRSANFDARIPFTNLIVNRLNELIEVQHMQDYHNWCNYLRAFYNTIRPYACGDLEETGKKIDAIYKQLFLDRVLTASGTNRLVRFNIDQRLNELTQITIESAREVLLKTMSDENNIITEDGMFGGK